MISKVAASSDSGNNSRNNILDSPGGRQQRYRNSGHELQAMNLSPGHGAMAIGATGSDGDDGNSQSSQSRIIKETWTFTVKVETRNDSNI